MSTERFCSDIGMFAIDRSIPESCLHRTAFCDKACFNVKLYRLYPAMHAKDIRNEHAWRTMTGADWSRRFDAKRRDTDRIRLMTRGEAVSNYHDLSRLADICQANPQRLIWCPTRAWRHPLLRAALESLREHHSNLALLASIDPSNSAEDVQSLKDSGWSTMFFGDDDVSDDQFKCPKTWGHVKGACAKCKRGCFQAAPMMQQQRGSTKPVHVHLKQH